MKTWSKNVFKMNPKTLWKRGGGASDECIFVARINGKGARFYSAESERLKFSNDWKNEKGIINDFRRFVVAMLFLLLRDIPAPCKGPCRPPWLRFRRPGDRGIKYILDGRIRTAVGPPLQKVQKINQKDRPCAKVSAVFSMNSVCSISHPKLGNCSAPTHIFLKSPPILEPKLCRALKSMDFDGLRGVGYFSPNGLCRLLAGS